MWFYFVAGTEHIVLGDLVYCKENSTGKVTEFAGSEYAEDCGDRYDSNNNEDDVSEDIHEEIKSNVKVSLLILLIEEVASAQLKCRFRNMSLHI